MLLTTRHWKTVFQNAVVLPLSISTVQVQGRLALFGPTIVSLSASPVCVEVLGNPGQQLSFNLACGDFYF